MPNDMKYDGKEPDNVPAAQNGGAGYAGDAPGVAALVNPCIYSQYTGRGQGQVFDPAGEDNGPEKKRLAEFGFDKTNY
jgi:hypothetical protein